jgi:hypothetical protein
MKYHSKNVPNGNFVVELAHFGLKRSNNSLLSQTVSSKVMLHGHKLEFNNLQTKLRVAF